MTVGQLIEKLKKEDQDAPIIFDYLLPRFFSFTESYPVDDEAKKEIIKEAFDECQQLARNAYTNFREIAEVVQDTIFQKQEEIYEGEYNGNI